MQAQSIDQAVDGLPAGWFDGFEDAVVVVLKPKLTAIGLLSKIPALEAAEVVAVVVVDKGHVVKAGWCPGCSCRCSRGVCSAVWGRRFVG